MFSRKPRQCYINNGMHERHWSYLSYGFTETTECSFKEIEQPGLNIYIRLNECTNVTVNFHYPGHI